MTKSATIKAGAASPVARKDKKKKKAAAMSRGSRANVNVSVTRLERHMRGGKKTRVSEFAPVYKAGVMQALGLHLVDEALKLARKEAPADAPADAAIGIDARHVFRAIDADPSLRCLLGRPEITRPAGATGRLNLAPLRQQ